MEEWIEFCACLFLNDAVMIYEILYVIVLQGVHFLSFIFFLQNFHSLFDGSVFVIILQYVVSIVIFNVSYVLFVSYSNNRSGCPIYDF